jgi:recombination protein RecA
MLSSALLSYERPARLSAAALRRELETTLAARVPAAFTVHERLQPEMVSSGVAEIDALTGGLPRGALTEIFGPASSGRTSLLLATLAQATQRGEFCCLVDASDVFDPHSATVAGVNLERLLWVRCTESISNLESRGAGKSGAIDSASPVSRNSNFVRSFSRASNSERTQLPDYPIPRLPDSSTRADRRVEQVLKAADLLLQGGGFGLVALDLADVPPQAARRVPLTSWFRFRRVVEHTPAVLLLLSQSPLTQSCASLVLQVQQSEVSRLALDSESVPSHARLLRGLQARVEVVRAQFAHQLPHQSAHQLARKPIRSAHASFHIRASWEMVAS